MSASEAAIKRILNGAELSVADLAALLSKQDDAACCEMYAAANQLKESLWGKRVAYAINLKLNFTNVCVQHCGFCNLRRDERDADVYRMTIDERLMEHSPCFIAEPMI